MIETSFLESNEDLKLHIFLMPDHDSLEQLLCQLGVK
ncbi:MAG: hypothetical protein BWY66_01091 [bacterium ADurb.Bin374]|nr:MAG: hypothetical protein BWY66_01091 [bacterium ADurb.Bin374]